MLTNKKVLFTSHRANFAKFNRPFMRWFKEQGYVVHYASAGEEPVKDCDKHFDVSFNRSPYSLDNITAYKQLKEIIEKEGYDIVHCHTPVGGVVTRFAAKKAREMGTRVLYTAHGFHFYKGAPMFNWLAFYPAEKYLSKYTDCIVTINQEDYELAKNKFASTRVEKIDGVGVDLNRFKPISCEEKNKLREEYGFDKNDFILIYVAEFINRKNHKFVINAIEPIRKAIPNIKILFVGEGVTMPSCQQAIKDIGADDCVKFMGYRKDVDKLCNISDVLISSSVQEGLPINIIEGMASGLPIVCASIRGQVDVIKPNRNGYLFSLENREEFVNDIISLHDSMNKRMEFGENNVKDVDRFSLDNAIDSMSLIYKDFM